MENISKEDEDVKENSIERKLTHSESIEINSTKLGNNASFLKNENSELISGNLETSEFVNKPISRISACILQDEDISISHEMYIESNLVIIKDDKDNKLENETNSSPILQNENLEDMSGGLFDMNKGSSGMYNDSNSAASIVLTPMKENIIDDMTGSLKFGSKHSAEEHKSVVKYDVLDKLNDVNKNNDTLGNLSDSSAFTGNESHLVNSEPFILGDENDGISSSSNISNKASSQIESHESNLY